MTLLAVVLTSIFLQDEEGRLLYDEANGGQYGSFGDQALMGENDTVETQRENEALQRVVARTSRSAFARRFAALSGEFMSLTHI